MRDNGFVTFILILALLYILSPIDLVPDVIPVVGWDGDLAVGLGAGAAAAEAEDRMDPGDTIHNTRNGYVRNLG